MSHTKNKSDSPRFQVGDKVRVKYGVIGPDFPDLRVDERGFIGLQVHGIPKGEGPIQVRWHNGRIPKLKPGEQLPEDR